MASTGCWTCKERKIRCDRSTPACSNCIGSNRTCQGYGRRLFWPRRQIEPRHLQGPEPPILASNRPIRDSRWVNTSFGDIELYLHRTDSPWRQAQYRCAGPNLSPSPSWMPTRLEATKGDLFQFFVNVALHNLTTCDTDDENFVGNISRLAFTDTTNSSGAVLQALLAVASLHRHGLQGEAIELQAGALRLLMASSHRGLSKSDAVQHVAASLLLCTFEVQGGTQSSGPWFDYVCSAKSLLNYINPKTSEPAAETKTVLVWLYYHDVMAQFPFRHWKRTSRVLGGKNITHMVGRTNDDVLQVPGVSSCSAALLEPLCEVFEQVVEPSDQRYHNMEYRSSLDALRRRLETLVAIKQCCKDSNATQSEPEVDVHVELYRLAALIYLERTSNNFSGHSPEIDAWTDSALQLIAKQAFCKHTFPIFIIGCEARTDSRRIVILDALDRTVKFTHSQSMLRILSMLQTVWNQDDLDFGASSDYLTKMEAIFSSYDSVPSFA